MGPKTGLDACGKPCPPPPPAPPGFDLWTVHPAASRYTDYAVPAHENDDDDSNNNT
jgi:hypothetical protein